MTKLLLKYNPYTEHTSMSIDWDGDGNLVPISRGSLLAQVERSRLQRSLESHGDWAGFFPMLDKALGKKEVVIEFIGTEDDFADLKRSYDLNSPPHDIHVVFNYDSEQAHHCSSSKRLDKIEALYRQWKVITDRGSLDSLWNKCKTKLEKDLTVTLLKLGHEEMRQETDMLISMLEGNYHWEYWKGTEKIDITGLAVIMMPDSFLSDAAMQSQLEEYLKILPNPKEPNALFLYAATYIDSVPERIKDIKRYFRKKGIAELRLYPICKEENDGLLYRYAFLPEYMKNMDNWCDIPSNLGCQIGHSGEIAVYKGIQMYFQGIAKPRAVLHAQEIIREYLSNGVLEEVQWTVALDKIRQKRAEMESFQQLTIEKAVDMINSLVRIPEDISSLKEICNSVFKETVQKVRFSALPEIEVRGKRGLWQEEYDATALMGEFRQQIQSFEKELRQHLIEQGAEYISSLLDCYLPAYNMVMNINVTDSLRQQLAAHMLQPADIPKPEIRKCTEDTAIPSYWEGQKAVKETKLYIEVGLYEKDFSEGFFSDFQRKTERWCDGLSCIIRQWNKQITEYEDLLRNAMLLEKRKAYLTLLRDITEGLTSINTKEEPEVRL